MAAALRELLAAAVRPEWLAAAQAQVAARGGGASEEARLKAVLQHLLVADLNVCGAPTLPAGVHSMHNASLPGRLLLQLDEVVNISAPARERYTGRDGAQRTLKLLLTDDTSFHSRNRHAGSMQVVGLEHQRIPALHSAMPAGTKLAVQGAAVHRGMLLLMPHNCWVLGGRVDRLEAARLRMVTHWNQPAVGRRGPPLSIEQFRAAASQAAWQEGAPTEAGAGPQPQLPAQQQQRQHPPGASQLTTHRLPTQGQQQQAQAHTQGQQQRQWQQQQQQAARAPASAAAAPAVPQPQSALALLRRPAGAPAQGPASGQLQEPIEPNPPSRQQQRGPQQQHVVQPPDRPGFVPASSLQQGGFPQQQRASGRSIGAGLGPPAAPGVAGAPGQQPSPRSFGGQQAPAAAGVGAGPTRPLQEVNGGAASAGVKRSRLQLPKPAQPTEAAARAREPSFPLAARPHQPVQQQWGSNCGGAPPAPLLQQLQRDVGANSGAAAGTAEDPIYLDSDDDGTEPALRNGRAAAGRVAAAVAGAGPMDAEVAWQDGMDAGGEEDWGEAQQEQEPQLDPWEAGYDDTAELVAENGGRPEGLGEDEMAAAAEGGWEAEEWEEEAQEQQGQEQQDGGDAEMADAEAGSGGGAAAGGGSGAAGALLAEEDSWSDDDGVARATGAAPAGAQPYVQQQQPARPQSTSGAAAAPASGRLAHQAPPPSARRRRPPGRRAQVLADSDSEPEAAAEGAVPLALAPQAQVQACAPAPERAEFLGRDGGEDGSDDLQRVPEVDDKLLAVVPTLAQVLSGPGVPALQQQAAGAGLAPQPRLAATPLGGAADTAAAAPGTGNPATRPSLPSNPLVGKQQARVPLEGTTPGGAQAAAPAGLFAACAAAGLPAAPLGDSGESSDDDMPQFGLLEGSTSPESKAGAGGRGPSEAEPFTYLCLLAERAAAAPAAAFPLEARVWGVVRTCTGKLQFRGGDAGAGPAAAAAAQEPAGSRGEYQLAVQIEDGTMVAAARLGSQFMEDLFDMPPLEFERQLAHPATKAGAAELVRGLQGLLASYCGLMRVRLAARGAALEVCDLPGALGGAEAAALQARAMGGAGGGGYCGSANYTAAAPGYLAPVNWTQSAPVAGLGRRGAARCAQCGVLLLACVAVATSLARWRLVLMVYQGIATVLVMDSANVFLAYNYIPDQAGASRTRTAAAGAILLSIANLVMLGALGLHSEQDDFRVGPGTTLPKEVQMQHNPVAERQDILAPCISRYCDLGLYGSPSEALELVRYPASPEAPEPQAASTCSADSPASAPVQQQWMFLSSGEAVEATVPVQQHRGPGKGEGLERTPPTAAPTTPPPDERQERCLGRRTLCRSRQSLSPAEFEVLLMREAAMASVQKRLAAAEAALAVSRAEHGAACAAPCASIAALRRQVADRDRVIGELARSRGLYTERAFAARTEAEASEERTARTERENTNLRAALGRVGATLALACVAR
eukprot:scaffold5.g811.t1